MFEFSVACKYILPRRRQLSVSIISLISVLVIALVVWLIVVFFSVTDGLEKNWVQKLTVLTAPIRITPTDAYYHSYYYLIDSVSEASNYSLKTIGEKQTSPLTDPYDNAIDVEVPSHWPPPDLNTGGAMKDLVKLVYASLDEIKTIPGLQAQEFTLTSSQLQLNLQRPSSFANGGTLHQPLSYPAFVGNFEGTNHQIDRTLLSLKTEDYNNILRLLDIHSIEENTKFTPKILKSRLKAFLEAVKIKKLKARSSGWNIPLSLLPKEGTWEVIALLKDQKVNQIFISQNQAEIPKLIDQLNAQGHTAVRGHLVKQKDNYKLQTDTMQNRVEPLSFPLTLVGGTLFDAEIDVNSLSKIKHIDQLQFNVTLPLQKYLLTGKINYRGLDIGLIETFPEKGASFWVYPLSEKGMTTTYSLPHDAQLGDGILLPRSFRESGVLVGDRGSLSYYSPSTSIMQAYQIPVFVAGFYDPGIIPIGGKYILAPAEVTALIRSSLQESDKTKLTNGINVRFDSLDQVEEVKSQLLAALKKRGVSAYWKIETYREFEFTKEIMNELQGQKNLFLLIAIVIILVACSNIISMLIILVNDKKSEIGILRSMGASSSSIALIFGSSGAMIGLLGSLTGILAALLTLKQIDFILSWLSKIQGQELLNAKLYGTALPHELSFEALLFVSISTLCLSLLAGIVPAIKACLLKPSTILRSGGS